MCDGKCPFGSNAATIYSHGDCCLQPTLNISGVITSHCIHPLSRRRVHVNAIGVERTWVFESYHGNWHAGNANQEHIVIRKSSDCQITATPGSCP